MASESSLQFYEKNKNIGWTMPNLPSGITTDYDIANWLLNKSNFGWLELDLDIDLYSWKIESERCREYLVPHRESDSRGWNSVCIHGINEISTGAWTKYGYDTEEAVPYRWTDISQYTPAIKEFWEKFPYDQYRRIRFMEVLPSGYIDPHSDMPGRLPGEENFDALKFGVPINIAITHPNDCYMSLEGHGVIPWQEGRAFIVNIRNYHSVINLSDKSRIHLIAHGKLNKSTDKFVELIARSYRKQYEQSH